MKTSDKKIILFKISKFPQLSETFIVNQIVTAIELGFNVKILVKELNVLSENSDQRLIDKYNIKDKIIFENPSIPAGRLHRSLKAIVLVIRNLKHLKSLKNYYQALGKKNLTPLFEFHFFKQFKNIDIIHIQFGTNKHPVDVFKEINFFRSKIIVSFHGHDVHFPINNIIPDNGYYDRLFQVADYLVVNTLFLKSKLEKLRAPVEKIIIIPVAVNTYFFNPHKPEAKFKNKKIRLITIGRLNELKGQEYGIEAVKILLRKGFKVDYIIAGTGNIEPKLKKLIGYYRLDKEIILTGRVSQTEVVKLLQESDVFLMTSVTDSFGMKESQGLVTAEAQACGLPVIAFDSGGVRYTILNGETGFIVPERNVEAMVDKIEKLIQNPDLRRRLGDNAQVFIRDNFSTNHINEIWRITYNNLINN